MFCSNCGKQITEGSNFCNECGNAVKSNSPLNTKYEYFKLKYAESMSLQIETSDEATISKMHQVVKNFLNEKEIKYLSDIINNSGLFFFNYNIPMRIQFVSGKFGKASIKLSEINNLVKKSLIDNYWKVQNEEIKNREDYKCYYTTFLKS